MQLMSLVHVSRHHDRCYGRLPILPELRSSPLVEIIEERPRDRLAVETIARMSLGQRLVDSPAARLRQGSRKIAELSLVALEGEHVIATIRCWPVLIGAGTRAIQLGPVAVDPDHRGRGISRLLITTTLELARTLGHRIVVLIGDGDIYARYGFEPALPRDITLAETRDRERLHVLALVPDALAGLSGVVRPDTIPALR